MAAAVGSSRTRMTFGFGWVGGWVGWGEENKAVRMRCGTVWEGGWVGWGEEKREEKRKRFRVCISIHPPTYPP